jgi:hypothetical protein
MSLFDRLPRRNPKTGPRHAASSVTRISVPGSATGDLHFWDTAENEPPSGQAAPAHAAAWAPDACKTCSDMDYSQQCTCTEDCGHKLCVEGTPAVRPVPVPAEIPETDEAAETLRGILDGAIPEPPVTGVPAASAWSTGPEVLKQAADALRALPAFPNAYLRCITPGDTANAVESLPGVPSFAGIARMTDGRAYAGIYLGDEDEDGQLVVDVLDVAWLGRLIDSAEEAREQLYAMQSADRDEAAGGTEAA